MRSVNIADLRDHLTQYLKEVRAGEEVVIRDRRRPIARIVPLASHEDHEEETELIAAGLMRRGEGQLPPSFWRVRRSAMSLQTAVAAVRADREGR